MSWVPGHGVVELPDGVRLRGRGLRRGDIAGDRPDWTLFVLGRRPADPGWPSRWVRWPDFWLPSVGDDASGAFLEAHRLAADGARVEVVCGGGVGRTGTALACIAQLGGVAPGEATSWIRARYHPRAVETPWQRRYVRRFSDRPQRGQNASTAPTTSSPTSTGEET